MTNAEYYLSWVNDFITVPCFAAYYGLSEDQAKKIIDIGREEYNQTCG
jgi:hypothetical protein